LIDRILARGPVPVLLQVYGSTETCPIDVYTRLGGDLSREGSTRPFRPVLRGRPSSDGAATSYLRVLGEIAVRGPNVFYEYGAMRKQRARRCMTAGIAPVTSAAVTRMHFWVHDRKKNLIISGGENIYPAEVERVLLEHPEVIECGVIGRPDSPLGRVACRLCHQAIGQSAGR